MSERIAVTILRLPSVISRTGLSRSSIYAMIRSGKFPPAVSLGGPRAVGWIQHEIDDWLERLTVKVNHDDELDAPSRGELRESRKKGVPRTSTRKPKGVGATPTTAADKSDGGGCEGDLQHELKVTPTVTHRDVERPDAGTDRLGVPSSDGGVQVLPKPSYPSRIQWPRR